MSEAVVQGGVDTRGFAAGALKGSAVFWFLVAALGQWLFAFYVLAFYGPTLNGNFAAWNRHNSLLDGYIASDIVGNLTFLSHVMMAAVLTIGGALQLVPQIRAWAIGFHRWNGRLFMLTALLASGGGLYLVWVRGTGEGEFEREAITLNAALIALFVVLAWLAVRGKNIAAHQRWAMRAFLVTNGVWFLRVGLMAWAIATKGYEMKTFFTIWSFGSVLVPIAVYEAYLFARDQGGAASKLAMAATLFMLTLVMGAGVGGAVGIMWLPRLQ